MDAIELTGVRAWAHHGVLAHEQSVGQPFEVDVRLDVDLSAAARSDDLAETIDYAGVCDVVLDVLASGPYRLIETVAARLLDALLLDERVAAAEVTVHKPEAPMPGPVRDVAVTMRRSRSADG